MEHEYLKRIYLAFNKGWILPGQACVADVQHDPWCPALKEGICNCNPKIILYFSNSKPFEIDKSGNPVSRGDVND